jgi:hypothetical protein
MVVRCTGACLDHNNVDIRMGLLRLNSRLRLHVIYRICKRWPTLECAMHALQRALWCMVRSNLLNLIYKAIYKFYFQAFLFINYLTKH